MSSLSHTMRSFNRFELKYMVSLEKAERFKAAISAYLLPDDHADAHGMYFLSSLYYDSPDFRCYWEKVDGIRFRRKLRIRCYENGSPPDATTPVYVEIKQRVDRVTQKRRILLPYAAALHLCSERQAPAQQPDLDVGVIGEILSMTWQYNLLPTSIVRYSRLAMQGSDNDIGLRVTIDRDLTYHASDDQAAGLDLRRESPNNQLFPAHLAIVEVKANERIPYWLTELIAANNLNLVRVSKYCRSIELSQNLPTPIQ